MNVRYQPQMLAALRGADQPAVQAARLVDLLLACPLPDAVQVQLVGIASASEGSLRQRLARLIHAIGTLPEYQLG